jgi:cytochrome P450
LVRTPAPAGLVQAKYLRAVCLETLRIRPIIPIVAREVQAPFEIQNYLIPVGVTVAAAIYLAHHRPEAFPEPGTFRPERFLHGSPSPFEFLPFGGGVRRCIGMALALVEMQIVLGSILASYELSPLAHELRPVRRFVTLAPEGGAKLRLRRMVEGA